LLVDPLGRSGYARLEVEEIFVVLFAQLIQSHLFMHQLNFGFSLEPFNYAIKVYHFRLKIELRLADL